MLTNLEFGYFLMNVFSLVIDDFALLYSSRSTIRAGSAISFMPVTNTSPLRTSSSTVGENDLAVISFLNLGAYFTDKGILSC